MTRYRREVPSAWGKEPYTCGRAQQQRAVPPLRARRSAAARAGRRHVAASPPRPEQGQPGAPATQAGALPQHPLTRRAAQAHLTLLWVPLKGGDGARQRFGLSRLCQVKSVLKLVLQDKAVEQVLHVLRSQRRLRKGWRGWRGLGCWWRPRGACGRSLPCCTCLSRRRCSTARHGTAPAWQGWDIFKNSAHLWELLYARRLRLAQLVEELGPDVGGGQEEGHVDALQGRYDERCMNGGVGRAGRAGAGALVGGVLGKRIGACGSGQAHAGNKRAPDGMPAVLTVDAAKLLCLDGRVMRGRAAGTERPTVGGVQKWGSARGAASCNKAHAAHEAGRHPLGMKLYWPAELHCSGHARGGEHPVSGCTGGTPIWPRHAAARALCAPQPTLPALLPDQACSASR